MSEIQLPVLNKKDFKSDQDVRWCPGCGDYSILNSVQAVLAKLGRPLHETCVVSGIGCSSRFPYYMSTYGFHTIHGRAPAVATGVKLANPDLDVWMITGDGDALSIGGNHTIHMLRRNVDINVLLFNNQIYGLTKGQYSPTSPVGLKAKSTPYGSIDRPFNPISLALGAGATFVARTMDTHPKHMEAVLHEAAAHKGTSFVEIFQNCVIFNDGCFEEVAGRKVRDDRTFDLHHGEKIIYGKDHDKGIRFNGFDVETCSAEEADVWDASMSSTAAAQILAEMDTDADTPVAVGVFRKIDAPTFDEAVTSQVQEQVAKRGHEGIKELLYTPDCWTVE